MKYFFFFFSPATTSTSSSCCCYYYYCCCCCCSSLLLLLLFVLPFIFLHFPSFFHLSFIHFFLLLLLIPFFLLGYVIDVLQDSIVYSEHANRTEIELEDVRLAIQARVNYSFTPPPTRELTMALASDRNKQPLPPIVEKFGVRLPPEKYCLTSINYRPLPKVPSPSFPPPPTHTHIHTYSFYIPFRSPAQRWCW